MKETSKDMCMVNKIKTAGKHVKEFLCKYKWWGLLALLLFVIIPLGINWLFKMPAPIELLDAEWYAQDALSFYGTLLASFCTIIGVYWSISYSQKNYREDERNRVRPYFAMTHLKSKGIQNLLLDKSDNQALPQIEPLGKNGYEEYRLDHIFIIIKENSVDYKYELTQTQKDILATGGQKWEEIAPGVRALTSLNYISLPFEIENVGNGAALCVQVGFYSDETERKGINFFTIKPNGTVYIHIFSNAIDGKMDKDYILELVYRDILGTQYSQKYPVRFELDNNTHRIQQRVDLTGTQNTLRTTSE